MRLYLRSWESYQVNGGRKGARVGWQCHPLFSCPFDAVSCCFHRSILLHWFPMLLSFRQASSAVCCSRDKQPAFQVTTSRHASILMHLISSSPPPRTLRFFFFLLVFILCCYFFFSPGCVWLLIHPLAPLCAPLWFLPLVLRLSAASVFFLPIPAPLVRCC